MVSQLRTVRSEKIDRFRKILPSASTSNLISWITDPGILAAVEEIDVNDEAQHETLLACMQSVADELDVRVPPRSKI